MSFLCTAQSFGDSSMVSLRCEAQISKALPIVSLLGIETTPLCCPFFCLIFLKCTCKGLHVFLQDR